MHYPGPPGDRPAFEDRNLLALAGLVPALGLAQRFGLGALPTTVWQCRPTRAGMGLKVGALKRAWSPPPTGVDLALLWLGAMPSVFDARMPSRPLARFSPRAQWIENPPSSRARCPWPLSRRQQRGQYSGIGRGGDARGAVPPRRGGLEPFKV